MNWSDSESKQPSKLHNYEKTQSVIKSLTKHCKKVFYQSVLQYYFTLPGKQKDLR